MLSTSRRSPVNAAFTAVYHACTAVRSKSLAISAVNVISPEMIWPFVALQRIVGDLLIAPRFHVTLFKSDPLNGCCAQMINGKSELPNTLEPCLFLASGNIELM